jgi:hypothetical protein
MAQQKKKTTRFLDQRNYALPKSESLLWFNIAFLGW